MAATVASAILFGLSFPTVDWSPLAWVALVPFLLALRGRALRARLALGWLWGVLAAYSLGLWFVSSVSGYFHQSQLVAAALFLAVASFMVSPYVMLFAALHPRVERLDARLSPFAVAAAWTACEWLRGRLLTGTPFFIGNPWGLLGYSQATWLPLMQVASWTGIYGVSFAVAASNAALAHLAVAIHRPEAREGRRAVAGVAAVALSVAALWIHGVLALREAERFAAQTPGVEVALVQGNVAIGSLWRADAYGENLDRYLGLTRRALAEGHPALVFWPESSMSFFVEDEPLYRRAIASVLSATGAELVAGAPRRIGDADPVYTNSVWQIDTHGVVRARYDKQILVPLAEYLPFGDIGLLRRRFGRVREFHPGPTSDPLPTVAGAGGVVVCNEAMLPEVVSERVEAGAEYLINPSNDTWVSHPQYTIQQFRIAATRAIEQRRTLVRISTAGPSAIVDPWGRILARSEAGQPAVVEGPVRPRHDPSVYHRAGDLFAVACGAATLGAALRRRRRTGGSR